MRVALMGVGSIGTIMGAFIYKNGGEITLIDANKEHVDALNQYGATVTGKIEVNVSVKAITPDKMDGIYDIVFYLVKQTYNNSAFSQLLPYLSENSVICTLQNGVPEIAVSEVVGAKRTVGGTVGWGATWLEPGKSMLTSPFDIMTFSVGEIDGSITDRIKKIKEILDLVCDTEIVSNLMGSRWTKLLINATFSGMSVALGCTYGDVLDNPRALKCAKHIANETIRVAEAQGIIMEEFQGHDLTKFKFDTKEQMQNNTSMYYEVFRPHRALKASMLQDIEKGRKCEIDAINGIISKKGIELGIKTPVNDKLVEIVKKMEEGELPISISNLDLLDLRTMKTS